MTKVGVVSDVVWCKNGGSTFGEISAVVSDVCACLMGLKSVWTIFGAEI